jgi:predicted nucleic acid-binding protein
LHRANRHGLTHLVDASVLTRLARPEVRSVLEPRAERGELARAEITDLEVGYSTRSASEWDRLVGALEVFELVATTSEHVRRAKQVQRLLAAKHQRGRKVPDLLIAAAAETESLIVLDYNADFDRIAAVTGQRSEWVVPAGSIG